MFDLFVVLDSVNRFAMQCHLYQKGNARASFLKNKNERINNTHSLVLNLNVSSIMNKQDVNSINMPFSILVTNTAISLKP